MMCFKPLLIAIVHGFLYIIEQHEKHSVLHITLDGNDSKREPLSSFSLVLLNWPNFNSVTQ